MTGSTDRHWLGDSNRMKLAMIAAMAVLPFLGVFAGDAFITGRRIGTVG